MKLKAYCIILSFYCLALFVMPCSDSVCEEKCTTEHHSEKDDLTSICSPFCNCSCCGSVIYQAKEVNLSSSTIDYSNLTYHNLYLQKDIINKFHNIWQPPKV